MENTKIRILALGYNPPIMAVVLRLINSHDNWNGEMASSLEEALFKLSNHSYDVVLLCAGVSSPDETILKQNISAVGPKTRLIRHFGGGSGLLESEIRRGLQQ
ncbi:response regulator receiver protein [Taibaiella koreensis]|uniref:response regulator receiver protein n=1 Tax=Taibaiella koreensis TaxID=1268548 RepID=UPI000E59D5A7|nr:response regulator receiver protein [Taibaiella koreensis]